MYRRVKASILRRPDPLAVAVQRVSGTVSRRPAVFSSTNQVQHSRSTLLIGIPLPSLDDPTPSKRLFLKTPMHKLKQLARNTHALSRRTNAEALRSPTNNNCTPNVYQSKQARYDACSDSLCICPQQATAHGGSSPPFRQLVAECVHTRSRRKNLRLQLLASPDLSSSASHSRLLSLSPPRKNVNSNFLFFFALTAQARKEQKESRIVCAFPSPSSVFSTP